MISRVLDETEIINIINDNGGGGGGGFTDTTWAALVALTTREAGQKYNITTPNPDDNIVYGQVTLTGVGDTFDYLHTSGQYNGFEQEITID